ncbi:acetoacetate decarboxylase family protein [Streptomyces collinus]|uniref:acetoacetate decarboxylase family protein n=1 Tax=Streptomyces collinus TaxID=42684 RepID=UPI0033C136C1
MTNVPTRGRLRHTHIHSPDDPDGWRPAAEAINRFYRTFDAWFGNKATPVNGFLEPSPESKFDGRPESLHMTAMIGTPAEVIERLRAYEELGVDEYSFWIDTSMSHEEKRKSLELFVKEVVPAFQRGVGGGPARGVGRSAVRVRAEEVGHHAVERPAVPFPPSPWHLTGDMVVSLWRVPADELPPWPLPHGVSPWIVRRRATLLTFWVDYRPGGVLAYREFLIALAVRHGRSLAGSTVAAWVDDERSLAGGRALWGIPKEQGVIALRADGRGSRGELTADGIPPVRVTYRDVLRLPFRLPARARLVQRLPDGTECRVPMRISGRPALGRSRVTTGAGVRGRSLDGAAGRQPGDALDAGAALSVLARRRPLLSLAVRDFRGTVGR